LPLLCEPAAVIVKCVLPNDQNGTVGALLRVFRHAAGVSQEELAERAGLSVHAVSAIERGARTRPHPHTLRALSCALALPEAHRALLFAAAASAKSSKDQHLRERLAAGDAQTSWSVPAGGPRPLIGDSGAPAGERAVPRQLPAAPAHFVGRREALKALSGLLDHTRPGSGSIVISAIAGMAGVGKTALALHWANELTDRFPDGQLYINLRGYDPSGTPVSPAEAIGSFLGALAVPPASIPADLQAQAALYRSLLVDKRMLVVVDNARDEQQVRPLLPAADGCLALITSRCALDGLVAAEGAVPIRLDVLTDDEAHELLTRRIGTERATAEPTASADLIKLCGHLPLAVNIAAARAATHPHTTLGTIAADLRRAQLDILDTGDPATSIRAVLAPSYQGLSQAAARAFRVLSLHPGPDISLLATASLLAISHQQARQDLAELTRAHLLTEHTPGRYAYHDLLRAYATEQARHDSQPQRETALGRMLDHYLHTAAGAALLLIPSKEPVTLAPPRPGTTAEQPADYGQALAWFAAEHLVLLSTISLADESGFDAHAWQLPWSMTAFLQVRGHWRQWAATQRTALAAAIRLGDTAAQALSGRLLAMAYTELRDHEQARAHLGRSLDLYRSLGNLLGEAKVHGDLGRLAERQGRYADALGHNEHALRLYQAVGHKPGEAHVLNNTGYCHAFLSDYQQARTFCRRALTLSAEVGDRRLQGYIWDSLGYTEHQLGNFCEATACYQRALTIARKSGERWLEAAILDHHGDTRDAVGELAEAREAWQHALVILDVLQHPNADQIRAKLASADAT
jgi:tetratricopeptide (TPR) repeat protein/transcriptional regulator with XRE-family HTH domain